jgi:hypothetical protein
MSSHVIRDGQLTVIVAAPARAQSPLGLVLQGHPRGVSDLGAVALAGDANEIVGLVVAEPELAEVPFDFAAQHPIRFGDVAAPHETRDWRDGRGRIVLILCVVDRLERS